MSPIETNSNKDEQTEENGNVAREEENGGDEYTERKLLCFSTEMLPCKFLVFFMDIGFGCFFFYISLLYIESGLTVSRNGLSNGIASACALIAGPFWGGFIDSIKTHNGRVCLLLLVTLGTTIFEFSRPWVVKYVSITEPAFSCKESVNTSHLVNCTASRAHITNPDTLFYAVVINGVISSFFISGLICFVEGAVIKTVFTRKTPQSYGKQKVFAPIGIALGTFLSGLAIDHVKIPNMSKYASAFFAYLPLSLLMIPFLYIVVKQADWNYGKKDRQSPSKFHLLKQVFKYYKNVDNIVFMLFVLVNGVSAMIYNQYLFLFMFKTMHPPPPKTMMSLTTVVGMCSELLFYPLSSKIIKMSGNPLRCVAIGIGSFCLRLISVSFCTKPWHILPIQLLHGVGMSLGWAAMIDYTWSLFPKDITTTAIGLLVGVHIHIASIISNALGGYLFQLFGPVKLFRGMSAISGVGCLLMFLYFENRGNGGVSVEEPFRTISNGCGENNEGIEMEDCKGN